MTAQEADKLIDSLLRGGKGFAHPDTIAALPDDLASMFEPCEYILVGELYSIDMKRCSEGCGDLYQFTSREA